tara:strand:- start:1231 stop:1923 length:693 start_codon:yes stop_codon:yes gene_type:complete
VAEPQLQQKIISIVLLGDFNPAIFHPQWLAYNELVSRESADVAKKLSCQSEFSAFEIDGMHYQVDQQRFGLTTKDESQVPILLDTVKGILTLLEHTPLQAVGLNHDFRYSMPDVESWHRLGHSLAPKDLWNTLLTDPGMAGVIIKGSRPDVSAASVDIRVHPIMDGKHGVFIGINQHYRFDELDPTAIAQRNQRVLNILNNDWSAFCKYALHAADKILRAGKLPEIDRDR